MSNHFQNAEKITPKETALIRRSLETIWADEELRDKYLTPYDVYVALVFPEGMIIDNSVTKSMIKYFEKKYYSKRSYNKDEIVEIPYLLNIAEKKNVLDNQSFQSLFKIVDEFFLNTSYENLSEDWFTSKVIFMETIRNTNFITKEEKEKHLQKYCNDKINSTINPEDKTNKTYLLSEYRPKLLYKRICNISITSKEQQNLNYIIENFPMIKTYFAPFQIINSTI
jgi:hypothetical protein